MRKLKFVLVAGALGAGLAGCDGGLATEPSMISPTRNTSAAPEGGGVTTQDGGSAIDTGHRSCDGLSGGTTGSGYLTCDATTQDSGGTIGGGFRLSIASDTSSAGGVTPASGGTIGGGFRTCEPGQTC